MAVLGSVVTYGISADDERAFRRRAMFSTPSSEHGHPVAGDEVPALVTKHYGGEPGAEVVDLVMQFDVVGQYWVGGVSQGVQGDPGGWW